MHQSEPASTVAKQATIILPISMSLVVLAVALGPWSAGHRVVVFFGLLAMSAVGRGLAWLGEISPNRTRDSWGAALLMLPLAGVMYWHTGGLDSPLWLLFLMGPLTGAIVAEELGLFPVFTNVAAMVSVGIAHRLYNGQLPDGGDWATLAIQAVSVSGILIATEAVASQLRTVLRQLQAQKDEAQLRAAEVTRQNARLEAVVASSQEFLVLFDGAGEVQTMANLVHLLPSARAPRTVAELLGLLEGLSPLGDARPVVDGGGTGPARWEVTLGDGLRLFDVARRETDGGESLLSITDVTADVRAERARQSSERSQKLEALGALAGGVAHDFNNILQVVVGAVGEATEDAADPKVSAVLDDALRAARQGAELTKQMLVFSKTHGEQAALLDVGSVVREMGRMLERALGSSYLLEVDAPAPVWVRATRSDVERVVMNLVFNARDAMPDGGRLELRAHAVRTDGALERACIRVRDEGVGMTEEVQRRLFEPFFSTKGVHGTGLGLATAYAIARNLDGELSCRSTVGQGTEMTMRLPLQAAPKVTLDTAVRPRTHRRGHIVLVEDNAQVQRVLIRLLSRAGFGLTVFDSGDQAWAALEHVEARPDFQLVLTDVVMPGMSGVELAERLEAAGVAQPILFLSGHAARPVQGGKRVAHDRLITKPVDPAVLVERLEQELATVA